MIVHIENDLNCSIEFHWEYNTKKGNEMMFAAKILPNSKSVIFGNYLSFHNGPYIRPSILKIADWKNNKMYLEWEFKNNNAMGIINDCLGNMIHYEINHKGKDITLIRFFNLN